MDETVAKEKLGAAALSVAANIFLVALKLVAAFATGSLGVIAEALHSTFDLLASGLAYFGIRKTLEPADEDHHFGHGKYEDLSSLGQAALILITGILIVYEAIGRLANPMPVTSSALGIAVIAITIVADYLLSRRLQKAGEEFKSPALKADAYHFTTDLWAAVAVIVGLALSSLGYPVFDPIAAIIVAIAMAYAACSIGFESLKALSDQCPSDEVVREMGGIVRMTPGVKNYHNLRARQAGSSIFAEVHIRVDGKLSVTNGHDIAHKVEDRLLKGVAGLKEVTVHVEPYRTAK